MLQSRTLRQNLEKFEQYKKENPQKALHYAQLVLNDLDSTIISHTSATILDFLATYNEEKAYRYAEALEYKERSSRIYHALQDERAIARTDADLGRLYLKRGDYHNAYNHSLKALSAAEGLQDSLSMREAWMTIEQVDYYYHKDSQRALAYNHKVTEQYHGIEQARQTVRALNNRFYYSLTPDEVREVLTRSQAICQEFGIEDQMINIYLNVACQEMLFEDLDLCHHYLMLAKELISNFKEEGYYYSASSFYHLYRGEIQQAINDTKRSIELLGRGDFDSKNVHSYFLLQDLYQSQGRYREAYEALMQFSEIYTRLHNSEMIIGLSKLINKLELEQSEAEHRRTQELNHYLLLILILCLIILAVIVTLFLTKHRLEQKNRRLQAEKAEQELNSKNELIKIQKLQQFQEQQRINSLTEELSAAIGKSDNKTMRAELNRIILHLRKNTDSGGDWAEVEKTMLGSNDTFFEKLLKAYPNLTKNERKLCTLVHMNLSTKEISNITHQSMGSINIARSRLRQKFGLTGSDRSLIAFLDQFSNNK